MALRATAVELCVLVLVFSGALFARSKKKADDEAAPATMKASAKLPTFAPLPETQPTQNKGGLQISIAPVQYRLETVFVSTTKRVNPRLKEALLEPHDPHMDQFVERTCVPVLKVLPDRVRFHVSISNQMSRVFHGAGTVVQFNIAGKLVAVDPNGYADLVNTILPPRSEQQLDIYGPPVDTLPDTGSVGLFFYDVVTNTDAAGNVTGKQNFEWYFNYGVQLTEKEEPVPGPERMWVHPNRGVPACAQTIGQ